MAITIRGIGINAITITPKKDGADEIKGEYDLVSSTDKVLAKQSFNGYGDMKINWSPETLSMLACLNLRIKKDIEMTLGLDEDSTLNSVIMKGQHGHDDNDTTTEDL
jgi:hypothetical protein